MLRPKRRIALAYNLADDDSATPWLNIRQVSETDASYQFSLDTICIRLSVS
jgi:hypothetical protein